MDGELLSIESSGMASLPPTRKASRPGRTRPGGAAMMNGAAYQLLWSIFRFWKTTVSNVTPGPTDLEPEGMTLILEPSGGGDLRIGGSDKTVEQIKTRSSGNPWTLQDVIEEVLPDLYKASRGDAPPSRYRFITEGRMGDWEDVYQFFRSIGTRKAEAGDLLSLFDDKQEFASASKNPALASKVREVGGGYTERGIFLYIAHVLREGTAKPRKGKQRTQAFQDSTEDLHRNLSRLLGGFEFDGDQMGPAIEEDVLDELAARGVKDPEQKLDSLVGNLLRRAREGEAVIERDKFLSDHDLQALNLQQWDLFIREGQFFLQRCLSLYGYRSTEDCRERRPLLSLLEAEGEEPSRPPVVLWGESGQGKSWLFYGTAAEISKGGSLALLIDSSQDIGRDREEAARLFCEEIWGHDERYSLDRLAQKVRQKVSGLNSGFWLTLFIDGVTNPDYLGALSRQAWGSIGIRVAVSFTSDREEQGSLNQELLPLKVEDFNLRELRRYLRLRLSEESLVLPEDILQLLRRPLWARLYRDGLAGGGQWQPKNEYHLLESYWLGQAAHAPVATDALTELARAVPEGADYPWSFSRLRDVGLGELELDRLRKTKLIRLVRGGRSVKLWHDRLLQWAIAEGLAAGVHSGQITPEQLQGRVRTCIEGEGGQRYGYVAMDALWLLADPENSDDQAVLALLQLFESMSGMLGQVGTLGGRIVPYLFSRLRRVCQESRSLEIRYLEILESISEPSIAGHALEMLNETQVPLQQAAARILASNGAADALDRLWDLYREWSRIIEADDEA
jgi:hypothetical protein